MSAAPPSYRDLEVYRLIRVERKSTREAAAEVGVSQTRVRQIVTKVAEFLIEAVPEGGDEKLAGRVQLAKVLAWERLDALHGEAIRCWRDSDEFQVGIRETAAPDGPPTQVVTRKGMRGDCKYLFAAAKLSRLQAEMPAYTLNSCFPDVEDYPEEDCSPATAETPAAEPTTHADVAASLPVDFTSILEAGRQARAADPFAEPAQPHASPAPLSPAAREQRRAFMANAG